MADGYDQARAGGAPDYPQVNSVTGPVSITTHSVVFEGKVVATGEGAAWGVVYWAEGDGGTDMTAWQSAVGFVEYQFGEVSESQFLSVEATMQPGRTYYYRFFVTNSLNEVGCSPVTYSFSTPSPPVLTTDDVAVAVGIRSAVVYGRLVAGVEANVWLHWGTSEPGVEPTTYEVQDLGLRTLAGYLNFPNPFRANIVGLRPVSSYVCRFQAENEYGIVTTPWVWFTTRETNFVWSPEQGWFKGGSGDGYSRGLKKDVFLPGFQRATLLIVR